MVNSEKHWRRSVSSHRMIPTVKIECVILEIKRKVNDFYSLNTHYLNVRVALHKSVNTKDDGMDRFYPR